MKDNSAEPWCPAVAGAGKLNVTREVGVGVDGLTDRVWPDGLADVVVAELAVEDTEAEPELVAGLEPPPHAASTRTVANTGRGARLIDQPPTNARSSRLASAIIGAPWASSNSSKSRSSSAR